mmetsp:Transcript_38568/g.56694  ORF Transcript_38568/g.56694 Transcript_38568/m.56694 type:complete len:82 (-) Transcript_38568:2706-2951(-)
MHLSSSSFPQYQKSQGFATPPHSFYVSLSALTNAKAFPRPTSPSASISESIQSLELVPPLTHPSKTGNSTIPTLSTASTKP